MNFRQVHLDFHTSPFIPEIGKKFDKKKWQKTLTEAAVNSITLFATCHHGYAYYNTRVGERHPHLDFDLLRAQIDACREIGVATPVYLTAGLNDYAFEKHPEWLEISPEPQQYPTLRPGFRKICFNTPYLDFLCEEIREVVTLFPEANGIFLDIISQGECCCPSCVAGMLKAGLDPLNAADRKRFSRQVLLNYYQKTTEAVKSRDPQMPVFHNSGHITINDYEAFPYFSHFELESLPTGGWGYDHYPMSAAYCRNLGKEFLGMTGKFHTTWGEFGGLKTPEALRYECAAMIANGSKCSIGDQLHPGGELDDSTYAIIGEAYREVAPKEPWCENAVSAAETAILSGILPESPAAGRELPGDTGAARILLENHIPFDIVDSRMKWSQYRFLVLPDDVRLTAQLAEKLESFRKRGGKLILSAKSGMDFNGKNFLLKNLPFTHSGISCYSPDYIKPDASVVPPYVKSPFVMYLKGERIQKETGISLGKVYDPYFNRTFEHYSSHQHTPYVDEPTAFDCGVLGDDILYFAHPVFAIYRAFGQVVLKEFVGRTIKKFMGDALQISCTMPSQGRITLMKQPDRTILHCLYANKILRGGEVTLSGGTTAGRQAIEVIDELTPCPPFTVSLKTETPVKSVRLVPGGEVLNFEVKGERIEFQVPSFVCHQMIELR